MTDAVEPDALAHRALREHGYVVGEVLGAGMEGTVLALGDDLVAKVWLRRTPAEAERLQRFYDAAARAGLTVPTPRIRQVLSLEGRAVTVEDRLRGRPLWDDAGAPTLDDASVGCVVDVLASFARVDATDPALASLPVLEGEEAFDPEVSFESSLASLVERRARRFHAALSDQLPDLERVTASVADGLRALESARPRLVHGDLIPANILVAGGRPSAVLDFGFLTTVGDPAFDAAVTASVFDMYGPGARETERVLDLALAARFDHEEHRIALHRAAYALVTANCFSPSGGADGHFLWCVAVLRRDDVRSRLGL